jgi:hypothetical protein
VLRIQYAREDDGIDTTRYYEYLINEAHDRFSAGYYAFISHRLKVSLGYGLLMFEDFNGHLIDARILAYGAYAKWKSKIQTNTSSHDFSGGYAITLWERLKLQAGAGYLVYEFSGHDHEHNAIYVETGFDVFLLKGLSLSAEYEYLQNRIYSSDNRIFVGLNYNIYKRL